MHWRPAYCILFALLAVLPVGQAQAETLVNPLVDTDWLQRNRQAVKVIDTRGDTKSFELSHVSGAVLIPFSNVRANSVEDGVPLQDMHLSPEAFDGLMRSAGINSGDAVVITHPGTGPSDLAIAAYLYWQMKYYGHDDVALLDGGTAKWMKENRPVESGSQPVPPGSFTVHTVQRKLLATTADTKHAYDTKSADLLDARPMSQFLGMDKRNYVDAYGHIPGAKVLPFDAFTGMAMGPGATFLPKSAVLRAMSTLGISRDRPVITYCNTGHMASVNWFVLSELLGFENVALFDGSMHSWAKQKLPTSMVP